MVDGLHHDLTVVQLQHLRIDEGLVGHIVAAAETKYLLDDIVLDIDTTDTTAGTCPDVMHIILDNTMNDVIEQTVLLGEHHWFGLGRRVHLQAFRRGHPRPAPAVNEHHVGPLALELTNTLQRSHHLAILNSQRVLPGQSGEDCGNGTVVQQSVLLSTYPKASLQVKFQCVDIRLQLTATIQRQHLIMDELACLEIHRHIAH